MSDSKTNYKEYLVSVEGKSENTADVYASSLNRIPVNFGNNLDPIFENYGSFFDIKSLDYAGEISKKIRNMPNFREINSKNNGALSAALVAYENFLRYIKGASVEKSVESNNQKNFFQENGIDENEFSYTKENFLSEVFIDEEKYNLLVNLLEHKRNIILQGAPGVGKTFAAKRLAYSIIGEKNENQIEFVQFHQNYSYEDFIMGYKPTEKNFEMKTGIFYNFCKKAESEPKKDFFFIIDEINRGNMSKIFGELLMLIEKDHREEKIKLSYSDEKFSVPKNLFIIGMMNTADRSLAIIDYALRRRFSFFEMKPAFDSDGFKNYQKSLQNKIFDKLIEKIKILNKEISDDKSLGKGFCIGHSYFCFENFDEKILRSIVNYEILPTLEEYFFDDENKFEEWKNILRKVVDDEYSLIADK